MTNLNIYKKGSWETVARQSNRNGETFGVCLEKQANAAVPRASAPRSEEDPAGRFFDDPGGGEGSILG